MRMWRFSATALVVVALTALLLFGRIFTASAEMPALPALTGRVVDDAGILSARTESELTEMLTAREQATGEQIVVVTLRSLQSRPIEEWGLRLGREWGIGQKGKDNGVVFLIAPNDRELRIEVGYGLEGNLPDATADQIIRYDVIPYFKRGDMEAGILIGTAKIIAALAGSYEVPAASEIVTSGGNVSQLSDVLVPVGFIVAFIVLNIVFRLRRRWSPSRKRFVWYLASGGAGGSSSSSSFDSSSGGSSFSGGGGSFGGGGASGKW